MAAILRPATLPPPSAEDLNRARLQVLTAQKALDLAYKAEAAVQEQRRAAAYALAGLEVSLEMLEERAGYIRIQHRHLGIEREEGGVLRAYCLITKGLSVEELTSNATILEVDRNGDHVGGYPLSLAAEDVAHAAREQIRLALSRKAGA